MSLLNNILAYWKLDAAGSALSLADSTPNGYTLANNGGVALGTGKINGGSVFNGSLSEGLQNLFTATALPLQSADQFSISYWLNYSSTSSLQVFYSGQSNYSNQGFDDGAGTVFVCAAGVCVTTPSSSLTSGWNHLVTTVGGGSLKLYVNGGLVATGTTSASLIDLELILGNQESIYPLTGSLDEVGIWNRALTSAEVTALYNGGNGISYPFSNKTQQTISAFASIANRVVGAAPFTITAPTASSGLAVTLSVKSGPATISGNTITLTGTTGTVVIAANQSGNATFDPAPEVTTSFSVTAATPSVGLTLRGSTSELILVSTNFSQDSSGQCMLRRVYSCATSYESVGRGFLAIDSAPLDGFLPSGVYSLVLSGLSVQRGAGISTFSADYIGLTTKAVKTTFSESTLSYSFVKTGTFTIPASNGAPATTVPVRYAHTGQYSAPVATTTQVATSASSIPGVPAGATQPVRATSSFRALIGSPNGQPMAPEPFTATYSTAWVLTDSQATPYGNRFIVTATYTRLITGVTN